MHDKEKEINMSKVSIVGGGAAGMLASIFAARDGHQVTVYEKNEKLGKKLYITGKGRCNVTNACDMDTFFQNMMANKKFLYSCCYTFTNENMMDFLREIGLSIKVERGMRVFPSSDKSSDVIHALQKEMERLHVKIMFGSNVEEILVKDNIFTGLKVNNKVEAADAVIIATGGLSYPLTGSTGDGYRFAKNMGHTIKECYPSLVPFNIKESFCKELQGLSLKNVKVSIKDGKKTLFEDFGEMLFTHFGVSGPLILSASSYLAGGKKQSGVSMLIDLKPALSMEQLDTRVLRDFEGNINKQFANSLDELLPKKMIPIIISLSGIDPYKRVNLITKQERTTLVTLIKEFPLTINSLRGYNEAVITRGGIKVNEVNPTTMESKLVKHVHFSGEVLDLDALTGGYNLQIAWSTAYAAATGIKHSV